MDEKHGIVIFSGLKAVITTLILFAAVNGLFSIVKLPQGLLISVTLLIGATEGILIYYYLTGLKSRGITNFVQTYDIDFEDNTMLLLTSWLKAIGIVGVIIINLILIICVSSAILITLIGGFAFVYMARDENNPIRYFIKGYMCGVGSLVCGLFVTFLISIFGLFPVIVFIILDAIISGIYTYMDLKEWEYKQNKNIENAKLSMGLK